MTSPNASVFPSRTYLRRHLRQLRRSLTSSQQRQAARDLCYRFSRNSTFAKARHIAFYLSNDGEINLLPLMRVALLRGKTCYLPRLRPKTQDLAFVAYRPGDCLRLNRFGIAEPITSKCPVALASLDLIFLPLVGYDGFGNRLGMGGGFYDRTLARWPRMRRMGLAGVAHHLQELPLIPREKHDIPLHMIATNRKIRIL